MLRRSSLLIWLGVTLGLVLAGCGDEVEQRAPMRPEPIANGDACHVCGMTIRQFPGPKGQAFLHGDPRALKFCSTLDLFTFAEQPENETQLSQAYVHDMGKTAWDAPADDAYINAQEAWYVVGHDRRGAMGHTLASFAEEDQAKAFVAKHGGRIIRYAQIDLALLGALGRGELQ